MNNLTGFLYARPSLIEGVARLIDFGGTLQEYNSALSSEQADLLALASDWRVVGDDLRQAMSQYDDLLLQETDNLMNEANAAIIAGLQEKSKDI
jgi:hypothetical protein